MSLQSHSGKCLRIKAFSSTSNEGPAETDVPSVELKALDTIPAPIVTFDNLSITTNEPVPGTSE